MLKNYVNIQALLLDLGGKLTKKEKIMFGKDKKLKHLAFVLLVSCAVGLSSDSYGMFCCGDEDDVLESTNRSVPHAPEDASEDEAGSSSEEDEGTLPTFQPASAGRLAYHVVLPAPLSSRERLLQLSLENRERGLRHLTEKGVLSLLPEPSHEEGHS